MPDAVLNLPSTGTSSALWGDSSSNWNNFFMTCFFSISEGRYLNPVSSPYHLNTQLLTPTAFTAHACLGTFTSVSLPGPSSSSLQTGDISSPGETATLKPSHSLRRGEITDWKSVNHCALDACPYSIGAHGLTLLWEIEGKTEKNPQQNPGLNPVPWPVAKEVKEQRVHLFSPCLLILEYLDLKAPVCAPDQLQAGLGRSDWTPAFLWPAK